MPVPKTVKEEAHELYERGSEMDLHRARRLLQAELRRDDSDLNLFFLLALVEGRLGDHDEAIRVMKTAVQKVPDDPRLLHNLGSVLKTAGRYAEAAQTFQRLLDGLPDVDSAEVAFVRRLARLSKVISEIGAARQSNKGVEAESDKSAAEIIDEMRR